MLIESRLSLVVREGQQGGSHFNPLPRISPHNGDDSVLIELHTRKVNKFLQ